MRKFITGAILFAASLPLATSGATPAREDRKLLELFAELNEADGYTYQISMSSQIVGDNKPKEIVKMVNYQSRKAFVIYSKSDEALIFLCGNGQFRINPKDKQIFYAQFPTDPAVLQRYKNNMLAQFSANAVDSFFLNGATITSKAATKNKLSYHLSYSPQSLIKDLIIEYDLQKSFFTSISYSVDKPMPGSESLKTGKISMMRQKVIMDHYESRTPPEVAQLLLATKDLQGYLERSYKGYKIEKINL